MYWFVNDHLGTPQKIADSSGQIVWSAAYLPFGKAQVTTETVANNLRFPGQYFDAESGLHYNWHRYYDPDTGRYITADPIGLEGGINLYSYVLNNPVGLADPEGLIVLADDAIIGLGTLTVVTVIYLQSPAGQQAWNQIVSDIRGTMAPYLETSSIGSNPVSHRREHELLNMPIPGYPQDPKDYCKDIKKAIEELTLAINWRGADMKLHGWHNNPSRAGHNNFRNRLIDKRKELQRKYDDFCKNICD